MTARRVDREKIERADRECKLVLDAERRAREAKTARLKAQRQFLEASAARLPPDPVSKEPQPPRRQKRVRKTIEVS